MSGDLLSERLAAKDKALSPTTRRFADYILQNRLAVIAKSAQELAQDVGTSDATVVRSVQALGFEGLAELRQVIVGSLSATTSPAAAMRQTLADTGASAERAVAAVIETHIESMRELSKATAQKRMVAATRVLHPVARIAIFGVGPSAGLAEYMRRLLARNGRASICIGATGSEFADRLTELQANDGLLVMAYGRLYREIEVLFAVADRLGLPVVLVTDTPDKQIAARAAAVVSARRGRKDHVALHAATLAVLEAIALALASADRAGSIRALDHMVDYRTLLHNDVPG